MFLGKIKAITGKKRGFGLSDTKLSISIYLANLLGINTEMTTTKTFVCEIPTEGLITYFYLVVIILD